MVNEGSGTWSSAFWEIVCGSIAGALGKCIEYPFDTVKVRMQTQGSNIFPTTWSCIKYTYDNEGIRNGFFQGIGSPIVGAALEHACLFVSYNQCFKFLELFTDFPNILIILIAGAFAGSCASFVLTPVELIKCKLQVSNLEIQLPDEDRHTEIIPTIRSILKERGFLGLWQGQSGTFIRESLGSMIWFGTFEIMKQHWIRQNSNKTAELGIDNNSEYITSWQLLFCGACAGLAFNGSVFPADTIKSVMQTNHMGLMTAIHTIKERYGIAGFYRGLGITLLRSIPSNAAVFFTYERLASL